MHINNKVWFSDMPSTDQNTKNIAVLLTMIQKMQAPWTPLLLLYASITEKMIALKLRGYEEGTKL